MGGMGLVWPILVLFQRLDGRLFAYYLMHDYAHTAQGRGAYDPALQQRMDEFRADIERALSDPKWDEVLVVGHSSGAHLGISVLAQIIRSHRGNGHLSFLSLGHVVPMVAYLPQAGQLRADLYDLSRSDQLMWVDVTAPGDACSFALAMLVRHYRFDLCSDRIPQPVARLTVRSKNGIWLNVTPRDQS